MSVKVLRHSGHLNVEDFGIWSNWTFDLRSFDLQDVWPRIRKACFVLSLHRSESKNQLLQTTKEDQKEATKQVS